MNAPKHGKTSTYNRHKCRCAPCREANALHQAKVRATKRALKRAAP